MSQDGKHSILGTAQGLGAMALAGFVLGSSEVQAVGTSMRVLEKTSPPAGHVYYCASQPNACLRYGRGAVKLTQASWKQLVQINARVNQTINPVEDGPIDSWTPYVSNGDCEDYVLTKQRELLRAGWPSDALLITTAFLPDGVYHAVLIVRTDRGEFVLDNLNATILPWQSLPYRWNKRQAIGNPQIWQRIAGAPTASTDRSVAGVTN